MHAEINKILVQEVDPRDMASGVKALRALASTSRRASSVKNVALPEQLRWTDIEFQVRCVCVAKFGPSVSKVRHCHDGRP